MSIVNVCAAFRRTGIYTINRDIFSTSDDPPLLKESGLAFIPLYSPTPRRSRPRYTERLSQGPDDQAREEVASRDVSEFQDSQSVWMQSPKSSSVSEFLKYPSPAHKATAHRPKSCGRVLMSSKNLAALEKKECEKKEKERLKLERKRIREDKKRMKATQSEGMYKAS